MSLMIVMIVMIIIICYLVYLHFQRLRIRRLFCKLIRRFEEENVQYWVDFGTLLGIQRDRDIILGDDDGDVCLVPTNENIEKVRTIVVNEMDGKWLDWGAFRVYDYGLFIDVYVPRFQSEQNIYQNPTGEIIPYSLIHPIYPENVMIGSETIKVSLPNQSMEVLHSRYGKNWRIPSRTWKTLYIDYKKDIMTNIIDKYIYKPS